MLVMIFIVVILLHAIYRAYPYELWHGKLFQVFCIPQVFSRMKLSYFVLTYIFASALLLIALTGRLELGQKAVLAQIPFSGLLFTLQEWFKWIGSTGEIIVTSARDKVVNEEGKIVVEAVTRGNVLKRARASIRMEVIDHNGKAQEHLNDFLVVGDCDTCKLKREREGACEEFSLCAKRVVGEYVPWSTPEYPITRYIHRHKAEVGFPWVYTDYCHITDITPGVTAKILIGYIDRKHRVLKIYSEYGAPGPKYDPCCRPLRTCIDLRKLYSKKAKLKLILTISAENAKYPVKVVLEVEPQQEGSNAYVKIVDVVPA
ncbi:MAG: hypothetical protein DRJ40_10750 [Thermoprotei archaeon]|nr:MAG: hypothetical protein DRJ40_10750 [Thermoprotei archaeon]